jgi:tetratricopeptide (TPR) repeat protein
METLYDLLGALPRDDAEELRAAFRRAVKGAHPDLNPGDPDAGQKFREIVRANEILGDEDQRAAYDHLLVIAKKEQRRQSVAKAMHKAATSVMALSIVTGLGLGCAIAYQYSPEFSDTVKHLAEVTLVRPDDFASTLPHIAEAKALPAPVAQAMAEVAATAPEARTQVAAAEPPPATTTGLATDARPPPPVASTPVPDPVTTSNVGPPLEIAPGDAKVFRERGIFAYRSGDFDGAIAEFDRAIQFDPKFSAAYVDRSIVLYRMQKFERAFADIAQAKRIETAKRAKVVTKKPKPQAAAVAPPPPYPFFQRHTARLEASTTP